MKVIFLLISFLSIILFPQDNLKYYAINAFKDSYLVSFDIEEIDYFLFKENYINILNYNLKDINLYKNVEYSFKFSDQIIKIRINYIYCYKEKLLVLKLNREANNAKESYYISFN